MKEIIYQTDDVKVMLEWYVGNGIAMPYYDIEFKLNGEYFEISSRQYRLEVRWRDCVAIKDSPRLVKDGYHWTGREIIVPDPTNIDINDYIPIKINLPPIDISTRFIGIDCKIIVVPIAKN
ncbi:hypothetical protein O9X90_01980 [Agrobacterium leguminum]|uniref:hypothetical protein n=1 Tax=Agrobacterium leguminum TaxID=2792015 RepID=UPI0022B838E6|nr:hypothetical protein [Agrobacterium leguminum]MCZ7931066.1 hypothetical protein [Agrobacterium leguminum]